MDSKTKYLQILERLLVEASTDSVTVMSKRLWKLQLIIDFSAATELFRQELKDMKECYNIIIDKDVDYEEWASNDKWKPLLGVLRSKTMHRYDNEGNDVVYDVVSAAAEYITVPTEDELNKALVSDYGKYQRLLAVKDERVKYRKLLVELDNNSIVTDEELEDGVLRSLNALQNVLMEIAKELKGTSNANEKRKELYRRYHQRFLPNSFLPIWDAHKVWKEWKEEFYGEVTEDVMKEFIMIELTELLKSPFIVNDEAHTLRANQKIYTKEISDYLEENLCDKVISNYVFLRGLLDFNNGYYSVKSEEIVGKYLYNNRKILNLDLIRKFFCFLGLNILVKKEIEKLTPPIDEPPIVKEDTQTHTNTVHQFEDYKDCIAQIYQNGLLDSSQSNSVGLLYIAMLARHIIGATQDVKGFVAEVIEYVPKLTEGRKSSKNGISRDEKRDISSIAKAVNELLRKLKDRSIIKDQSSLLSSANELYSQNTKVIKAQEDLGKLFLELKK